MCTHTCTCCYMLTHSGACRQTFAYTCTLLCVFPRAQALTQSRAPWCTHTDQHSYSIFPWLTPFAPPSPPLSSAFLTPAQPPAERGAQRRLMLAVSVPSPAWEPNRGSRSSSWMENDVQEGSCGWGCARRHPLGRRSPQAPMQHCRGEEPGSAPRGAVVQYAGWAPTQRLSSASTGAPHRRGQALGTKCLQR